MNESRTSTASQRGAALIVVLMVLLIVTLLGLAAMRGAILQERMASATLQRGEAFQAAESALRQGEVAVQGGKPTIPATGCAAGVCATTPAGTTPLWADGTFWASGKASAATTANAGMSAYYVIESYGLSATEGGSLDPALTSGGSTAEVYRIVSHAESASGSEVTLQSIYRVKR